MSESTFLSRSFGDQGVRLRIRKEPRTLVYVFVRQCLLMLTDPAVGNVLHLPVYGKSHTHIHTPHNHLLILGGPSA